jgi:Zn-dependent peptidase ImmA (M78 family)/DNA-binding transcriptional regulator YiaG
MRIQLIQIKIQTTETTMQAKLLRLPFKSENSDDRSSFNPTRLALARKRKGLRKSAFATRIGVDRKSVEAYESGKTVPSDDTIDRIVRVLEFPREFFVGDDLDEPSVENGSFRSMKTMTAVHRDMALSQAALGLHFNVWLSRKFELPQVEIPDLGREPDPETAAEVVRREWQIGTLSIRNMIHLLESKGVRVYSLAVDARQVDAFSIWKGGTPFVFLNTNKTPEHSRFDAAHELGHLVLHKHGSPRGIDAERQANMFASAFLMPRASVLANSPRFATYESLVRLKRKWGVSVAALAYRLHGLGLVSDWHFRGLYVQLAEHGKQSEPNPVPRESSIILKGVLASLQQDGLTRLQIARHLTIPTDELEQLLFGLTISGINGGGRRIPSKPPELTRVK